MLSLQLDRSEGHPVYRQIAEQVRDAISRGRLAPGERLPTSRALAGRLGVNRLTVSRAYADLARDGWIAARVGSGTFVATAPGGAPPRPTPNAAAGATPLRWHGLTSRATERAIAIEPVPPSPRRRGIPISFASQFPDPGLFPVESFRSAMDQAVRRHGAAMLGYGHPAGYAPLRRLISDTLRRQGMAAGPGEILITSGSQQGIDLVARCLVDPGDTVLVENPTYTGAVQVFHSFGADLMGVPLDAEGVDVAMMEDAIRRRRPKLIYLMPNFQNPTSETMSLKRRRAVLDLAVRHGLPILEDDFGGDLRFEGPGLPTLRGLDRAGHVIYLSTFTKKLLPGLRIGWIAAPAELAERLVGLKKITDYSTSLLLQVALHEFCTGGHLDRHLARVVEIYRHRRDVMLECLEEFFPPEASWSRPQGGLAVWVTLPEGADAEAVALEAAARGVLVGRGDLFYVDGGTRRNLRLTFSQPGPREIRKGIRTLGEIIRRQVKSGRAGHRAPAGEALPFI